MISFNWSSLDFMHGELPHLRPTPKKGLNGYVQWSLYFNETGSPLSERRFRLTGA